MEKTSVQFSFVLFFVLTTLVQAQLRDSSPIGTGETIIERFSPPQGFHRVQVESHSFAEFLRRLPLLPENSPVQDYRSRIFKAAGDSTIAAVINLNIKGKKLEQCMDIILRLYAEYCLQSNKPEMIGFLLPDKSMLYWRDWIQGWRPIQTGGEFPLHKTGIIDNSRESFESYLQEIFYNASTQTNYFGLPEIPIDSIAIGDFLIKKGMRGHAVLLMDMIENAAGDRMGLFAQGDTPACQMHILRNNATPWIPLDFKLSHPELPIRKKMYWQGLRRLGMEGQEK